MKDSIVLLSGKSFPSAINTAPETSNVISSSRAPQESIIERLYNALSLAPITDSETGITFISKAIYDCHNMPDGNALRWSLRLNYNLINPTKLEDFDHIKTFNEYLPEFDGKIFTAHSCLPNVVETCKQAENQEKLNAVYANKCQDSTAYVRSKILRNIPIVTDSVRTATREGTMDTHSG
ncbi:hypothetical protein PoB_002507900 [Plakobranchus ocellatus]|uniref:Uncharacterized protein n=1 Tax=Plakobranchus ocellatus TaxID=259542 RepID=A0AAV3ZXB4_9GAST|nr:hypothetical protein PoB_002507900 [Plakobranchus ocellatus]